MGEHAVRMDRLLGIGSNQSKAAAEQTPMTGTGAHPGAPPNTPMTMPLTQVRYYRGTQYPDYGTMTVEVADVIWSADGAPIPGSAGSINAPGVWGRVVPAGNPSPAHQ
jgi:hypothetical protein